MSDTLYIGGNGWVYAIDGDSCGVVWSLDLNPGWFAGGNRFVSLRETEEHVFAFTHGRLHKIEKRSGRLVGSSEDFPKLRRHAGVFSTTSESTTATDGDTSLICQGGSSDGCGDGGCGDGGDD
jgi:hypothetical protein